MAPQGPANTHSKGRTGSARPWLELPLPLGPAWAPCSVPWEREAPGHQIHGFFLSLHISRDVCSVQLHPHLHSCFTPPNTPHRALTSKHPAQG